jgi:hypothetical protein
LSLLAENAHRYRWDLSVPKVAAKMAVEGACWYDRNVEGLPAPTADDQYGAARGALID